MTEQSIDTLHRNKVGKVSDKWDSYLGYYDILFGPRRHLPVSILEIGVQNGGSLETWARYFESGVQFVGCDINPKCGALKYDDPRIRVVVGDANAAPGFQAIRDISVEFDIVIDDGSHVSTDILNSFVNYFPMVKPGGLYVVEDTHTIYSDQYGGGILNDYGAYAFFKKAIDAINYQFWCDQVSMSIYFRTFFPLLSTPRFLLDGWIEAIEFRNSIITIRKALTAGHNKLGGALRSGCIAQVENFNGAFAQMAPEARPDYASAEGVADRQTENPALVASRPASRIAAESPTVALGPVAPLVHLYQIVYSAATVAETDYHILDNFANERPDWREYWPIRRYLINQLLDEDGFYGFFSSKFGAKTNLTHAQVTAFVQANAPNADVMLFSPQPDMGAFFLNVFEQAETFDPGLIDAYSAFLAHIDRPLALHDLLMDSRHVVFSNYFVARPAFWREWLAINEPLFDLCEGADTPLRRALCMSTTYPGAVERKVFLQERAASLLLATQSRWRSVAYNPFGMAWSMSRLREHPTDAVISDALKMALRDHAYPQYLEAFRSVRERFRASSDSLGSNAV